MYNLSTNMPKLSQQFFQQNAELVAKQLLGKVLVRKINGKKLSGIITETEAYLGLQDLASHASRGKTERNKVMFENGGIWYVYMIYGMHFNLNVVTGKKDFPSAVLIRAIQPLENVEEMRKLRKNKNEKHLTNGPGKLCQALNINKSFYGTSAFSNDSSLYIEDQGIVIKQKEIIKTKRIGVEYAKEWKDKLLRFYIDKDAVERIKTFSR
jgi:DNA-3-methyladenine glycosylase